MAKYCFCCGKKVKWLDSDLVNGKVCDECFEKAKAKDKGITRFNITNYRGEYIKSLVDKEYICYGDKMGKSKSQKAVEAGEKTGSVMLKVFVGILAFVLIIGLTNEANDFIDKLKRGEVAETKTAVAEEVVVDENLSPDEYIERLKNGTPMNADGTVDELFRRHYGTPKYKYEEEDGKKYVLLRADSNSMCETVTFYFRIEGNNFVPEKGILRDQVAFKDNYLSQQSTDLLLSSIFRNN